MSKIVTWKVEALEPRERCNFILEVRAASRENAEKQFRSKAVGMETPYGDPSGWAIIAVDEVEPWEYPEDQPNEEDQGDTLTSAEDEE